MLGKKHISSTKYSFLSECPSFFTHLIALTCVFFLFSQNTLNAQKITKDNYSGYFTDNNSWQNPPAPNLAIHEVVIYGNIQHIGDISFQRNLTIHDTLRIFGNVELGNNCDLTVSPGGIFIVYGNYLSKNMVDVLAEGYLIVTGTFKQEGADGFGSFDINGGNVFIFDPNPDVKEGLNYEDLQCNPDCLYGNEEDLQNDPIWQFFESGSYSISASGPTEFCDGDSVTLSVTDDGSWYQWYRDDTEIPGADSFSYVAYESGAYHIRMLVGSDTLSLTPVTVNVKTNSISPVSASVDRDNVCPGDGNIVLSYTGGSLGTGAIAQWYSDAGFSINVGSGNDLVLATPLTTTTYYVRFEGDCDTTTTASVILTVLPASPVPTISLNPISPIPASANSTNLGYSAVTGSPSLYSITWSGAAITAGFINVTDAAFPASPILINIPPGIEAGQTYTGNLIVMNDCNTSVEYPFNISVLNKILGIDPHATAAYSLRKLSSTYSGPAVRVRRSSDNATQDIGFNAEGNLDEVALLAFTGAVNAYITIWYDQSGNSQNALQGNTNYQPLLVENGIVLKINGRAMLRFDGSNDLLNYSNPPANNFSIFTLARTSLTHQIDPESNSGTEGTAGQLYLLGAPHGGTNAGQGISFGTNGISNYEHGAGYMPATAVYSGNVTGLSQINVLYTNRRARIYLDGLLVRTGVLSGRPAVTASTQIGSGSYGAFNGEIPELIIFPSSLSDSDRQTIEFDQGCHYLIAGLTPGVIPGIADDATTASLPYTEGTNQIWTYSITWDANAIAAGFNNIANETLPVSPVTITVPSGLSESDVFSGTFSAINACGSSIPDHPITIRVLNRILGNDIYATTAFSVRRIAPAYSGPAMRLTRTSDGEFRDVYFDSGETVSLNSPVSVAGGGTSTALTLSGWIGGSSATVRIWYDQSGNAKHANQSNIAAQPLIANNGELVLINTRPMIQFDGVNDIVSYSNPPENNFSLFTIARTTNTHEIDPQSSSGTGGTNNQRYLMGAANRGDNAGQGISLGTNGISNYEHGNSYMPATAVYTGSVTGLNLVDILYNSRRPYIYLNGNLVRTGIVSPKATVYASYQIGGMNYGYFNGSIPEIIVFPYAVSSTERQQIECNQIEYYSILGPSTASIDTNNICPGDGNITLSYSGGNLRAGATAEWYSDSALTVNVGSGNNLTIPAPINNSEYFVRFEGICNTSLPVSTNITVKELPVEPDTAIVDRSSICPSDGNILLSFSGGSSGTGGIAKWYTDAAFTNLVGTDNDISLPAPAATQTYYIRYEADCGNSPSDSVTVIVNPLPVVTLDSLSPVCLNTASFALNGGNPIGGNYSGTGVSGGNFVPATAGAGTHSITYTYTDANGCTNSATRDIMVNTVPTVTFDAVSPVCVDAPAFDLAQGAPAGGTYSGTGITASPQFDPATAGAGTHTITYTYTDANGCDNSADRDITVHSLPVVSFSGLDPFFPITDPSTTLSGDPAGGTFSGPGISGDTFDPSLAGLGIHEIVYEYTDGNGCTNSDTLYTEVLDYDFMLGAITLTDLNNWYSGDAVYTTTGATADGQVGSCWNYGNDHTRWFKFQATTNQIAATFLTGSSFGTVRRINAAIWESDGTTQVNCNRYISDYDSVVVESPDLVPGNWYYISVTSGTGGYRGTFSLRVNDQVDYDYYEGAIELTDITNWESPDAVYTTRGATADKNAAPCWNTSPNYNRWFKFQATTNTISILVRRGGAYGTIRRINAAIWEADGTSMVSCNRYIGNNDSVYVESVNLTPGNWYYISVDNNYSGYRGTFSLRVDTRVTYDYIEGAYELQDLNNWCSTDAIFSTYGATPDLNPGSCWNTSPNYNRWFKFVATTHRVNVDIKRGGTLGTIRRINVVIWESDGTTQISCNRYVSDNDNVSVGTDQLIPGNTYYISVDNNYSGYRGSFTLCIDNQMDYDYLEGAKDITTLINSCSNNAEYTTIGATPDRTAPPCWNTSPNYNRWFKFMATTQSINVQLKRGGVFGTLRRAQIALYDKDTTTVLDCNRYVNDNDDIEVAYEGLTPGEWYFISVDNNYSGYRGTFTLCLDDKPSYDFYEGAIELGIIHDWSSDNEAYTTIGATPDKNTASCWNTGPNYNRWFKFTATTSQIHIKIRRGGVYGTIRRVNAAIWEADGETEVNCKRYVNDNDIIEVESINLIPGNTYYLSVDNNYSGYRGTFSLYINDVVDYDFYEGARDVSHLINSQSSDQEYTTIGATSDKNPGSCWNTSPNYNRWFKFQATTPGINIIVLRGGSYGTIRRVNVALFDADGTTELSCNRYVNDNDIVELDFEGLVPGNWYYFSVDNNYSGYRGTFTLALNDAVSYDYYEGAIELTDIHNWSSPDAAYSTLGATPDKNAASCWNTGPNYNRWFKFTATTPVINVEVRRGGSYGTIRRINAAIWEADGITEVACNRYVNDNDNISVGANILIPGNTYYISVDNNYSGYRGTFSLYIDDAMDYDFYEGAHEITDLNNWESGLAEFTTLGATADKNAASCWNTSPNYNRWFKFQAIYTDVSIQVLRGGAYGSIRRINLALWESNGTTELACNRYASNDDNVSVTFSGLIPGNWYYISVDNNYSGYRGTFTLQVSNVSGNVYYAIADGNWNTAATWSLSEGGPPAVSSPANGDVVYIKGFDVTVSGTETCAELNIETENDQTSLTIDAGTLTVNGELSFVNNGYNVDGFMSILNSGNLSVIDDLVKDRSGGSNTFQLLVQDNSTLFVGNDMNIFSSAGSTINNEFTVSGTATVQIDQDLILQNTGGIKSIITLNNSAELKVKRDIRLTSSAQDKMEIELNNDSRLYPGRTIQRDATPYGILDCNDNSTLVFNSSDYLQIIPENAGAGSDNFSYQNIEVNNTRVSVPQLSLEGPVSVPGTLTLTNGVILTSSENLLTIENTGSISGGSVNSYIQGPIEITGNTAVTFPVGRNGRYQPITVSAPSLISDAFIAEYFDANPNPLYNIDLHEAGIDHVADSEYWTLQRSSGTSAVDVTISWDGNGCCISDLATLKVAIWDGAEWKNYGNGGTNGTLGSGDITTANVVDLNSCAITFADHLPIADFTDPGGPYCESAAPFILTGNPADANGVFTGNGITDNGDGTAQFNPGTAGNGSHQITYSYTSVSGCSNSVSKYVTVNPGPTATIIGTDTVCIGTSNEFSIFFTGTPPWDVTYTDGTNSFNVVTTANPYKFITNVAATYSVTALSDANGCIGTVFGSSAELVNWPEPARPLVSIVSGSTTFCEGNSLVLETPPASIYYWNNGISTQQNTITDPGNYWVSIVNEHGCFSDNSDTTTVIVHKTARKPSAISGNVALCQNNANTTYITSAWYADAYIWDIQPTVAGNIIGTGSNIQIDWEETFAGVAKLSVKGSNINCGEGPVSDTLYISLGALPDNPGPISGDQIVCQGQSAVGYSIDAVTNASSYSWTLPANAVFSGASNSNSITVDYLDDAVSGDITVQPLNACGSGLTTSSLAIDIQLISLTPTGISKSNDNICPGDPVTLTVQGGSLGEGADWKWYLDDAFTLPAGTDGSPIIVNPLASTTYWVRAEGDCNNTSAVNTTITIKELPAEPDTATVDRPSVCPSDGNIVLSYSGGSAGTGGAAKWYSDAGFTNLVGTGNDINLPAPATNQTYYIRFEADCGNSPEKSVTVTVNPLPVVTFAAVDPVYVDDPDFTLDKGSPTGGTYSGTGISGDIFSPSTAGVGVHTISYTYSDANGCTDSANTDITVNINIVVSFDTVVPVCINSPAFDLTQGSPAGGTYSGTGITTSPQFDPAIAGAGTHTITYTYTDIYGNPHTAARDITVNAVPVPSINGPAEVCQPGTAVFFTTLNADHSYTWTVTGGTIIAGDGTNQISVDFTTSGTAEIQVTETNNNTGCSGISATYDVNVLETPVINEIDSNNKLTLRN